VRIESEGLPEAPRSLKSGKQFMPRDLAAVDRGGDRDPVFLAEGRAIMRTVRRGAPGTGASQRAAGRCSLRYAVTRLLVRHAVRSVALRSVNGGMRVLPSRTTLA
jgi:hypothetical protein